MPLAADPGNPYKGLRPFDEEDDAIFFGRDALVGRVLARLGQPGVAGRFLVLAGPSGCGKSSLVRAGIVPALRRGALPGSAGWQIAWMAPGQHPAAGLTAALGQWLAIAAPPAELLLVVDPLEALFTQGASEETRAQFVDQLVRALDDEAAPLRVICTLRADFYDRPLLYPALAPLIQAHTEVVIPMDRAEVERAIRGPAEAVGLPIDPELVAAILHEVEARPGALPLLQHALHETFARRSGPGLRLEDYRATGGLAASLDRRAEEIYHGLEPAAQELARQIFLRLVALGEGDADTRRRVDLDELATLGAAAGGRAPVSARDPVWAVIERFAHHRLLTCDFDLTTGVPTVELAHEALIDSWRRFRQWIDSSREQLRTQRRLTTAAAEWAASGRNPGFLPSGLWLAQYEALAGSDDLDLSAQERAYIAAGVAERDSRLSEDEARRARELALAQATAAAEQRAARRLRWLVAGLCAFLVALLALSTFAVRQQRAAQASYRRAEAQRLAAEAIALYQRGGQHELVALLAIQSLRRERTAQGQQALDLAATLDYPLQILAGHDDLLSAAAYTADGSLALTGGRDGTLRVWDPRTGAALRATPAHPAPLTALAPDAEGQWAATGAQDGALHVWDPHSGAAHRQWPAHEGPVRSLRAAPAGRLVSAGDDGAARLWQAGTGEPIATYLGPAPLIDALPTPDGGAVLLARGDGVVLRWALATGQTRELVVAEQPITAAGASPDGGLLALGHADGRIGVYDAASGALRTELRTEGRAVSALAFAPDGRGLAAGGADAVVYLLDLAGGRRHTFTGSTVEVAALAFAPDGGGLLASSGSSARIWELGDEGPLEPVRAHTGAVTSAAFAPDGQLALTGGEDGTVRWWDAERGRPATMRRSHSGAVTRLAFSPDGQLAASGGADGMVRLWSAASARALRRLALAERVADLTFSADGRLIAAAGSGGTLAVWEAGTGAELRRWPASFGAVHAAAFEDSGTTMITATSGAERNSSFELLTNTTDATVISGWSLADGSRRATAHLRAPRAITFEADHGFKRPGLNRAVAVLAAFTPDGGLLLAAHDNSVQLWDPARATVLASFVGHGGQITAVAASADGRTIATASADGSARLWDGATGAELRRLTLTTGAVTAVALAPDGGLALTGSDDGSVQLWRGDLDAALAALCGRLRRDLRDDERSRYALMGAGPSCM